jgi:hypothetical protein
MKTLRPRSFSPLFPAALLAVILLAAPACQPLAVDPAKATAADLSALNSQIAAKERTQAESRNPVIVTGTVVSVTRGRTYPLVVGLRPADIPAEGLRPADPQAAGGRGEIILCLFRAAPENADLAVGSVVSIAGLVDRASIENHLFLTSSALVPDE